MTDKQEKTVPISYFKAYKKAMQDLLQRKERIIKELKEQSDIWRKTAMKQSQQNYDLSVSLQKFKKKQP